MQKFFIIVSFIIIKNFQINSCSERSDEKWKLRFNSKLVKLFSNDRTTLGDVMFFFDKLTEEYGGEMPPLIRTFEGLMENDKLFEQYAKLLAKAIGKAENDKSFRKILLMIHCDNLEISEKQNEVLNFQKFSMEKFSDKSVYMLGAALGYARAWTKLSKANQIDLLRNIKNSVENQDVNGYAKLVNNIGGNNAMIVLAAAELSLESYKSIDRWWRGEISGYRCSKIIVDTFSSIVGGSAGGAAGVAIGAVFGPVGAMVGGIAGGIIGKSAAHVLSDRMTQWIFNVPKDEALENAYRYFKLSENANYIEINQAYRQFSQKHKGNAVDYHYVQVNMAIIKVAKENN